ncbi:hypothetical protein EDB87DRAFT_1632657 [Lactarius vividus]|nr:hypothetical protein EDB87DRAFT_1632657 [Lactarius vividus]
MGLLDVTFSSDLLSEPVKDRRAIICAKACDPAHIPISGVFDRIWSRCQYSALLSAKIVEIMSGWGNNRRNHTDLVAAVCRTVARTQQRDDSWFILTSDELGIQEHVLREYAAHGDSLSLAVLIHMTRQQFSHLSEPSWPSFEFVRILETASKLDAQDTPSELQHGFCALWNQIVLKAQSDSDRVITGRILRPIRNIYVTLHQGTDSAPTRFSAFTGNRDHILWDPSSYPVCNVAAHIHDDDDDSTFTCTALDDDAVPVPASLANPDTPLSSIPASLRVVVDVPLLDNTHPAHQTTTECLRIAATSPDLATADAFVIPGIIIPHPTSPTSTPLSTTVSLQHSADLLAPSDPPISPLSALSDSVLDNTLPTESHSLLILTTAPRNPPPPISAPNLDLITEDDGSPKPSSHNKENDALDPPSVSLTIHGKTMALDRLLESSSLPLVAHSDVVIVGPSLGEPNTEDIRGHILHPSHCPYDIV